MAIIGQGLPQRRALPACRPFGQAPEFQALQFADHSALPSSRITSAQSPLPGFGENNSALSGLPSQSFASGGGSRFTVMFGHT